jgi:hypothetical protein
MELKGGIPIWIASLLIRANCKFENAMDGGGNIFGEFIKSQRKILSKYSKLITYYWCQKYSDFVYR